MFGTILVLAVIVFVAGMIVGAIALVSIASLREDKNRLSPAAPDRIARAGRLVTGLRIENPRLPPARRHDEARTTTGQARPAEAGWHSDDQGGAKATDC